MEETKLEYIDWKQVVEKTIEEIKAYERLALVSRKLLKQAEEELKKYSPSKLSKEINKATD